MHLDLQRLLGVLRGLLQLHALEFQLAAAQLHLAVLVLELDLQAGHLALGLLRFLGLLLHSLLVVRRHLLGGLLGLLQRLLELGDLGVFLVLARVRQAHHLAQRGGDLMPLGQVARLDEVRDHCALGNRGQALDRVANLLLLLRTVGWRAWDVLERDLDRGLVDVVLLPLHAGELVDLWRVEADHLALGLIGPGHDLHGAATQVLPDQIQQALADQLPAELEVVVQLTQRVAGLLHQRVDRNAAASPVCLAHHRVEDTRGVLDALLGFVEDLELLRAQAQVRLDLDRVVAHPARVRDHHRVGPAHLVDELGEVVVARIQCVGVGCDPLAREQPHQLAPACVDLILQRHHRADETVGHAGQVFPEAPERHIGQLVGARVRVLQQVRAEPDAAAQLAVDGRLRLELARPHRGDVQRVLLVELDCARAQVEHQAAHIGRVPALLQRHAAVVDVSPVPRADRHARLLIECAHQRRALAGALHPVGLPAAGTGVDQIGVLRHGRGHQVNREPLLPDDVPGLLERGVAHRRRPVPEHLAAVHRLRLVGVEEGVAVARHMHPAQPSLGLAGVGIAAGPVSPALALGLGQL